MLYSRANLLGHAPLNEVRRRFRSVSQAHYKDSNGKKYILVTGSPLFNTERLQEIAMEYEVQVSTQQAIMDSIKHGGPGIMQLERTKVERVVLKRVSGEDFSFIEIYPVYFVYI